MTMKKYYIYIIGMAAALFIGCSEIDEADRFLDVEGVTAQRTVLLEDFTGQMCSNCPNAHELATEMHADYGENLIIVSMHAGGLSLPVVNNTPYVGLMTPVGNDYANEFGVEVYPSGLVNRKGGVLALDSWRAKVHEAIQEESDLGMDVHAEIADGVLNVTTDLVALDAVKGKLQLWVLEDSIVSVQFLPTGGADLNYVHNHVFRGTVNGTWGEDISLSLGEEQTIVAEGYTPDDSWKKEHLSVVAFVYNNSGVLQAAKAHVILKD